MIEHRQAKKSGSGPASRPGAEDVCLREADRRLAQGLAAAPDAKRKQGEGQELCGSQPAGACAAGVVDGVVGAGTAVVTA